MRRRSRVTLTVLACSIGLLTLAVAGVIVNSRTGHGAKTSVAATPVAGRTASPAIPPSGGPATGTPATATPAPARDGRGYLGVGAGPVDTVARQRYAITRDSGAVVLSVEPGSGAARAGIAPGDVITSVDSKAVRSVDDLTAALSGRHPADRVVLTVVRRQNERTLDVTLGDAATVCRCRRHCSARSSLHLGLARSTALSVRRSRPKTRTARR